ncbi:MAG TPA: IS5 family transposase [Isosphaeraceae bacterium]
MRRHEITDDHWERIKDFLPGQVGDPGVTARDNRLFVNAILWLAKTGAPWRDLPGRFGNWNSVAKRFARWVKKGVWLRIFQELKDPDLEWLILDSTVIRAHQHAAGAGQKGGADQALGRSRGGFGTKSHIAVDGLGNPVEFILTGGQESDVTQAEALMQGYDADVVIADKGSDSDALVRSIQARGGEAVIPPKKNRTIAREYDKHLYKERNLAERFINRIKQYRRVATRYEKTGRNFLGFVHVAAVMVLLL